MAVKKRVTKAPKKVGMGGKAPIPILGDKGDQRKKPVPKKKPLKSLPVQSLLTEGCDCTGLAGGTIFACEDDSCVAIEPEEYFAILVRDPTGHSGIPYWERPANIAVANSNELTDAIVLAFTPTNYEQIAAGVVGCMLPVDLSTFATSIGGELGGWFGSSFDPVFDSAITALTSGQIASLKSQLGIL